MRKIKRRRRGRQGDVATVQVAVAVAKKIQLQYLSTNFTKGSNMSISTNEFRVVDNY